jgi:hypothetical protein
MKKKNLLPILLVLAVMCFIHHQETKLAVTTTTARAAAIQSYLKSAAVTASNEGDKPQASDKIPLVDFNSPIFHMDLLGLAQGAAVNLWLHPVQYGVTITPAQRYQIARAIAVASLGRMLYEAEIANVDDSDPSLVKVSIPAYDDSSIRDYLIDQIAKATGNLTLAKAMAGDGRNAGAYSQNIVMLQKTVAGDHGEPVAIVMLDNKTMSTTLEGIPVPMTIGSSFLKYQPGYYRALAAFLK